MYDYTTVRVKVVLQVLSCLWVLLTAHLLDWEIRPVCRVDVFHLCRCESCQLNSCADQTIELRPLETEGLGLLSSGLWHGLHFGVKANKPTAGFYDSGYVILA